MKHLTAQQLCEFLDGAIPGAAEEETARHLESCASCRARHETWLRGDEALRELLSESPAESALEQWSLRVERAVTAERKGLPVPEFAELRLPLPPSLEPPAPEVPRVGTPPRPQDPARFATLGDSNRPQGRPLGERARSPGARFATRRALGPPRFVPPPPDAVRTLPPASARAYARLPSDGFSWRERLAREFGPPSVWVPLVILIGLLAAAPLIPVVVRLIREHGN